jgi:hypothetical protein
MFEFLGLIGVLFLFGLLCLAAWIVLLPFYLLFKLMGFAIKIGLMGIFVFLGGLILLPVLLVVGAVLLLKILIIGLPLLLAIVLFSWLVGFLRPSPQAPIPTQVVPPTA